MVSSCVILGSYKAAPNLFYHFLLRLPIIAPLNSKKIHYICDICIQVYIQ